MPFITPDPLSLSLTHTHTHTHTHMRARTHTRRAIKHLLELLTPHSIEKGGVLKVEHVTYVEGRGNLLLEYASEGAEGTVAFVGSHLDVVPANPETWERNPFKLTVEVREVVHNRCPWSLCYVVMMLASKLFDYPGIEHCSNRAFPSARMLRKLQRHIINQLLVVG